MEQRALGVARDQAQSDQEWKALYEDEIANLKKEKSAADELGEFLSSEAEQYERQTDEYKGRIFILNQEIDRLRAQISAATGERADARVQIPGDLDELQSWAETNLAGRVLLHARALRSAKKSRYENVSLIYRALLLLGNEYRDMKMNRSELQQFQEALQDLGLELDRSITKERAGEQGDEYYVTYPPGTGSRVLLDSHLRKGTSKDERHCLRIYFFWDPEGQQVIIGSLPAHLETRAS